MAGVASRAARARQLTDEIRVEALAAQMRSQDPRSKRALGEIAELAKQVAQYLVLLGTERPTAGLTAMGRWLFRS